MGNRQGRRRRARHREVYAASWDVVLETSLRRWAKSECLKWGFDYRVNYRTNLLGRLRPWATGGRYLVAKLCTYLSYEMYNSEHTAAIPAPSDDRWLVVVEEYFYSVVYLPNWYSLSDIYDAEVIGSRDDDIVVQLNRSDWNVDVLKLRVCSGNYTVRSVFSFRSKNEPYRLEACLSPDCRYMCIKPSWEVVLNLQQHPEENNVLLVDVSNERGELKETLFWLDGTERVLAFDPRYHWRRLAVGRRQTGDGLEECVCIYDLHDKTTVCKSHESPLRQTTHNLVYSPDGRYLASLVIMPEQSGWRDYVKEVDFVVVYSADDLAMLHRLPCMCTPSPINFTAMAMFPLFSDDGRYMCFQYDNYSRDFEWKVKVVSLPFDLSLQHLCRLVLRNCLTSQQIRNLRMPTRLRDYVQFRPYVL